MKRVIILFLIFFLNIVIMAETNKSIDNSKYPKFEVKELKIEINDAFFSLFGKKIILEFSIKVLEKDWLLIDIEKSLEEPRKLSNKEYDFFRKKYEWIDREKGVDIFRITPIFKKKKGEKQFFKYTFSITCGGPGLNIFEFIIGDKKKLKHWFRPK
jgi:hypothetical protein